MWRSAAWIAALLLQFAYNIQTIYTSIELEQSQSPYDCKMHSRMKGNTVSCSWKDCKLLLASMPLSRTHLLQELMRYSIRTWANALNKAFSFRLSDSIEEYFRGKQEGSSQLSSSLLDWLSQFTLFDNDKKPQLEILHQCDEASDRVENEPR